MRKKPVKVEKQPDVFRFHGGKVYLGREPITDAEKKMLISEAKAIGSMRLWSIIGETTKQLCYERGWVNSKTIEELNVAKAMFNILETQQSIVAKFKGMV